ncbi:MAG: TIR domain-containing protein [Candidatus Lokiarchaeota archaeon]|nr:TIR domain-containing protein [Candidatus Lokiarchaeota archaeon]
MGLVCFVSYATKDREFFRVRDLSEALTNNYDDIDNVYYWEEHSGINIIKYMNDKIDECDIFIFLISENSVISKPVKMEWESAISENKYIIPVYTKVEYIPTLLKRYLRHKFDEDNFERNIKMIHSLILRCISRDQKSGAEFQHSPVTIPTDTSPRSTEAWIERMETLINESYDEKYIKIHLKRGSPQKTYLFVYKFLDGFPSPPLEKVYQIAQIIPRQVNSYFSEPKNLATFELLLDEHEGDELKDIDESYAEKWNELSEGVWSGSSIDLKYFLIELINLEDKIAETIRDELIDNLSFISREYNIKADSEKERDKLVELEVNYLKLREKSKILIEKEEWHEAKKRLQELFKVSNEQKWESRNKELEKDIELCNNQITVIEQEEQYKSLLKKANTLVNDRQWSSAIPLYEKLKELCNQNGWNKRLFVIEDNLKKAIDAEEILNKENEYRELTAYALDLMGDKRWEQAKEKWESILDFINQNELLHTIEVKENIEKCNEEIAAIQIIRDINSRIEKAEEQLKQKEWNLAKMIIEDAKFNATLHNFDEKLDEINKIIEKIDKSKQKELKKFNKIRESAEKDLEKESYHDAIKKWDELIGFIEDTKIKELFKKKAEIEYYKHKTDALRYMKDQEWNISIRKWEKVIEHIQINDLSDQFFQDAADLLNECKNQKFASSIDRAEQYMNNKMWEKACYTLHDLRNFAITEGKTEKMVQIEPLIKQAEEKLFREQLVELKKDLDAKKWDKVLQNTEKYVAKYNSKDLEDLLSEMKEIKTKAEYGRFLSNLNNAENLMTNKLWDAAIRELSRIQEFAKDKGWSDELNRIEKNIKKSESSARSREFGHEKYLFKILFFSRGGAGSTTFLHRLVYGEFNYLTRLTIGVEIFTYNLTVEGREVTTLIYDFAGEDRWQFALPLYIEGASGAVILYDRTRWPTITDIPDFVKIARTYNANLPFILVGAKSDLEKSIMDKTSVEEYLEFESADSMDFIDHLVVSAKTGKNILLTMQKLILKIFQEKGII